MRFLKGITAFVFILALMLSLSTLTIHAEQGLYGIVTADMLNIRSEASTSSDIIGQISNGTFLEIVGLEPGWAKVTYSGNNGYVSTDYILIRTGQMPARSNDSTKGQQVIEYAKEFLGTPYKYGGMSPKGFDCSGFTKYVYSHFGVSINRVASDQMRNGTAIENKSDLLPGDLVFFYSKVGSKSIGHVGIYAGGGQMIHSPYTGTTIRFETIMSGTYSNRFAGGRRIFN